MFTTSASIAPATCTSTLNRETALRPFMDNSCPDLEGRSSPGQAFGHRSKRESQHIATSPGPMPRPRVARPVARSSRFVPREWLQNAERVSNHGARTRLPIPGRLLTRPVPIRAPSSPWPPGSQQYSHYTFPLAFFADAYRRRHAQITPQERPSAPLDPALQPAAAPTPPWAARPCGSGSAAAATSPTHAGSFQAVHQPY